MQKSRVQFSLGAFKFRCGLMARYPPVKWMSAGSSPATGAASVAEISPSARMTHGRASQSAMAAASKAVEHTGALRVRLSLLPLRGAVARPARRNGPVAQRRRHLSYKQGIDGSSPSRTTASRHQSAWRGRCLQNILSEFESRWCLFNQVEPTAHRSSREWTPPCHGGDHRFESGMGRCWGVGGRTLHALPLRAERLAASAPRRPRRRPKHDGLRV